MKNLLTLIKNKKKTVISGVVLLVLLVLGALFLLSGNSLENKLCSTAKDEIKTQLKAPATAEFGSGCVVRKGIMQKGGEGPDICGVRVNFNEKLPSKYADYENFYEVTFQVDAENSYGAKIREMYSCNVEPDLKTWCTTVEDAEDFKADFCTLGF